MYLPLLVSDGVNYTPEQQAAGEPDRIADLLTVSGLVYITWQLEALLLSWYVMEK